MNSTWLLMLPAFALAACGHDADPMMSDYVQDLGRHMKLLQAEETSHASAMNSLSTLDGMQGFADSVQKIRWDDGHARPVGRDDGPFAWVRLLSLPPLRNVTP
jgi:hypothetical protein